MSSELAAKGIMTSHYSAVYNSWVSFVNIDNNCSMFNIIIYGSYTLHCVQLTLQGDRVNIPMALLCILFMLQSKFK